VGLYYKGDGVRLAKSTNADVEKRYVVDGMNTVVEQDAGGYLRYKYVYANGMLLARVDSLGRKFCYHHDALGSTIGISDSNYAVYKSYLYDEFGDSLGAWGSTPYNAYRYTGQEYDGKPAYAYNLRAREYYPKLGRFMQNDPIGDQGGSLNWYLYVANNPINATDPTGLFAWYMRYGHYCGKGQDAGRPTPIDALDAACQAHDDCYGKLNLAGIVGALDPFLQSERACGRDKCDKALCEAAKNFKIPYTDAAGMMAARNARGLIILKFCSGTSVQ